MGNNKAKLFLKGLFRGMKSADDVISTQASFGSSETGVHQQAIVDSIYNDLLRGEETQRVKEMRDEYYRVLDEASKRHVDIQLEGFERNNSSQYFDEQDTDNFFSNDIKMSATSRKKTALDFVCKVDVLNDEKLPLVCIQDNIIASTTNNFSFDLENDDHESIFKFKRGDFYPRFKVEDYLKRIVIRKIDDNTSYVDIYVPMYASQFGFILGEDGKMKKDNSSLLISELERLRKKELRTSDVVEFEELTFDTEKAYGVPNPSHFEFDNMQYVKTDVFDGNFVVTLRCHNRVIAFSAIEKYHTDELDEKLKNHAPREGVAVSIEAAVRNMENEQDYNQDENRKK